jgi:hypothetical protein
MLLVGGAAIGGSGVVQAATIFDDEQPVPTVQPDAGTYLTSAVTNKVFRESPITYKGKNAYYFVTQDVSYAARNGETVYVTFDGTSGSVADTGTADGDVVFAATVIYMADGKWTDEKLLAKGNSAFFFDAGTYRYDRVDNYTVYAAAIGVALIGLEQGAVRLTRRPYLYRLCVLGWDILCGTPTPYLERILIPMVGSGVLWQNLVFDFEGRGPVGGVATASTTNRWSKDEGATWLTSLQVFGTGRGNSVLHIEGGASALIRDCEFQNSGAGYNPSSGNQGLNIVATSYNSSAQVNIEGVRFTSISGSTTDSYRIVTVNTHPNVNIRDLVVDRGAGLNDRDPFWIETPNSESAAGDNEHNTDVRFAGTLSFPGYTRQRLGVQFTSIENITPPDNSYRWATFMVGSAAPTMFGSDGTAVFFYDDLANFTQTWPSSDTRKFLLYDTRDNTWVVRAPSSTNGVVPTIEQQLQALNTVLARLNQSQTSNALHGRGLVSDIFVKVVADDSGNLPAFNVPDMASTFSQSGPNIHIRAVPSAETLFSAEIESDADMVPVAVGDQWSLNSAVASRVRIYGVDFATEAHYTLHEVTSGGTTQQSDAVAGVASAVIANSTPDTFILDNFVALASEVTVTNPTSATIEAVTGDVFTAQAAVTAGWTHATVADLVGALVDDRTLIWSSANPSVATVDPVTGVVNVLAEGVTTIQACAVDSYNQGEFQRPCAASFTLTAVLCQISAVDDHAETPFETPVVIRVLDNDTGYDLELSWADSVSVNGGTIVVNSDGSHSYTPAAGFSGEDTYRYEIKDRHGHTAQATVYVKVSKSPVVPTGGSAVNLSSLQPLLLLAAASGLALLAIVANRRRADEVSG